MPLTTTRFAGIPPVDFTIQGFHPISVFKVKISRSVSPIMLAYRVNTTKLLSGAGILGLCGVLIPRQFRILRNRYR